MTQLDGPGAVSRRGAVWWVGLVVLAGVAIAGCFGGSGDEIGAGTQTVSARDDEVLHLDLTDPTLGGGHW